MAEFPESLVEAATEAIIQSWSPETEYDEAGRAAAVAMLRDLANKTVNYVSAGTLRRAADKLEGV